VCTDLVGDRLEKGAATRTRTSQNQTHFSWLEDSVELGKETLGLGGKALRAHHDLDERP
jgi:hypothetical protein